MRSLINPIPKIVDSALAPCGRYCEILIEEGDPRRHNKLRLGNIVYKCIVDDITSRIVMSCNGEGGEFQLLGRPVFIKAEKDKSY